MQPWARQGKFLRAHAGLHWLDRPTGRRASRFSVVTMLQDRNSRDQNLAPNWCVLASAGRQSIISP